MLSRFGIEITRKRIALSLIGSAILAFGLYHVHAFAGVMEGGVLGLTLVFYHFFALSPAISGAVLNVLCYVLGFSTLGRDFLFYSAVSGGGFSVFYAIFEQFPPLWPQLESAPLLAALVGAVFVGVGVGLAVRAGGAPGGDDALAMSVSKLTGLKIEQVYLISDLTVLALSATYLPLDKLACSLLTVILSGRLVGVIQRAGTSAK